jgi:hypothetical protein
MQDAVIAMAIIVVALALWRLHSRPSQLGPVGSLALTNIFGRATLSFIPPGSAHAGNGGGPPPGGGAPPAPDSNPPPSISNNVAAAGSNRPSAIQDSPASNETPSAEPLNTNGPVTEVDVPPAQLVETPAAASGMERRLNEAGAKGGDIQISLFWTNVNDLDLHCIDPKGEEICYTNKKSTRTGGELDVDQNASPPFKTNPVENIYWPVGGAPPGEYRVSVVHYANHGGADPTAFTVRMVIQGQTYFFNASITCTGRREAKLIRAFVYDPANPDPSRRVQFLP